MQVCELEHKSVINDYYYYWNQHHGNSIYNVSILQLFEISY